MTDVIISVNPTYLAILAQTDGELALSIAFNGVQMKLIFDTLSNRFVDDALLAYVSILRAYTLPYIMVSLT
jgi:hypothetical protein